MKSYLFSLSTVWKGRGLLFWRPRSVTGGGTGHDARHTAPNPIHFLWVRAFARLGEAICNTYLAAAEAQGGDCASAAEAQARHRWLALSWLNATVSVGAPLPPPPSSGSVPPLAQGTPSHAQSVLFPGWNRFGLLPMLARLSGGGGFSVPSARRGPPLTITLTMVITDSLANCVTPGVGGWGGFSRVGGWVGASCTPQGGDCVTWVIPIC